MIPFGPISIASWSKVRATCSHNSSTILFTQLLGELTTDKRPAPGTVHTK